MIKKNIGIFTYDFYPIKGGQGTHLINIYKKLIEQGFNDFKIFSPCTNKLKNHITIFPHTEHSIFKNIAFSFKLFFNIKDIIKKHNLSVVHIHGGPGGLFFCNNIKIPLIYTCHHTYWQQSHYIRGQRWKQILYFIEKIGYNNAHKIICVSEDTKRILKQKYGIPQDKLIYIPNGINLSDFKSKLKVPKDPKSLVFVGRLDKRKGIDFLVKTMTKIKDKDERIKLYIIGNGILKNKLQKFISRNGLENNVFFLGFMTESDLIDKINTSEIFVVPSMFEGFGITILEGMACKTPVIGTNVDGIKNIINDGNNGLLTEYGDINMLVDQIIGLFKNRKLQNKIIKNAYDSLDKYYNRSIITQKIICIYDKFNT